MQSRTPRARRAARLPSLPGRMKLSSPTISQPGMASISAWASAAAHETADAGDQDFHRGFLGIPAAPSRSGPKIMISSNASACTTRRCLSRTNSSSARNVTTISTRDAARANNSVNASGWPRAWRHQPAQPLDLVGHGEIFLEDDRARLPCRRHRAARSGAASFGRRSAGRTRRCRPAPSRRRTRPPPCPVPAAGRADAGKGPAARFRRPGDTRRRP